MQAGIAIREGTYSRLLTSGSANYGQPIPHPVPPLAVPSLRWLSRPSVIFWAWLTGGKIDVVPMAVVQSAKRNVPFPLRDCK